MLWPTRSLSSRRPHPPAPTASGKRTPSKGSSVPSSPKLVARYEAEFAKRLGKFRLEWITKALASIPVRRLGTVEDISHLICFLSSDDAAFINGETVNINGGYYMD